MLNKRNEHISPKIIILIVYILTYIYIYVTIVMKLIGHLSHNY